MGGIIVWIAIILIMNLFSKKENKTISHPELIRNLALTDGLKHIEVI